MHVLRRLVDALWRVFAPKPLPPPLRSKGVIRCPYCDRRVAYFNTGRTSRHSCLEGVKQVALGDERLKD